jgi:GR25 family glycosyltransferase involved in LPS biosynthesis
MIRTYVVTKKNSPRTENIHAMIKSLESILDGPHYCIGIDDGNLNSLSFDSEGFEARYGRPPSYAEIGCALGHRKAYQSLSLSLDSFALILEDDARIAAGESDIRALEQWCQSKNFDIIILGYSKFDKISLEYYDLVNPRLKFESYSKKGIVCHRFFESTSGSVAYLVSKRAAIAILRDMRPNFLSDDWPFLSAKLSIMHASPPLIWEDFLHFESLSGHANAPLRPFEFKHRIMNIMLLAYRNFKHVYRKSLLRVKFLFGKRMN